MFKITFNLIENEEDYNALTKQYKLKFISKQSFKAFLRFQNNDNNFVFDLLSKCLINAKNIFLKLYDKEIGIKNVYFLDRAVDQAFKSNVFSIMEDNSF